MQRLNKIPTFASAFILLSALLTAPAYAATIRGRVTGPDAAPFAGAFVEAQNAQTQITFIVLSDSQGRYRVENIPSGRYRVQVRAVGYGAKAQETVHLGADQNAAFDFALQTTTIRWSDLSIDQARALLPADAGKKLLFRDCFACHGFQTRMAAVSRDLD